MRYFRVGFLADEDDFGLGYEFRNSFGSGNAVQRREANVEEDQVGFQFLGAANGFQSVAGLADDLETGFLLKRFAHEMAEGFVIVDQENPECESFHLRKHAGTHLPQV